VRRRLPACSRFSAIDESVSTACGPRIPEALLDGRGELPSESLSPSSLKARRVARCSDPRALSRSDRSRGAPAAAFAGHRPGEAFASRRPHRGCFRPAVPCRGTLDPNGWAPLVAPRSPEEWRALRTWTRSPIPPGPVDANAGGIPEAIPEVLEKRRSPRRDPRLVRPEVPSTIGRAPSASVSGRARRDTPKGARRADGPNRGGPSSPTPSEWWSGAGRSSALSSDVESRRRSLTGRLPIPIGAVPRERGAPSVFPERLGTSTVRRIRESERVAFTSPVRSAPQWLLRCIRSAARRAAEPRSNMNLYGALCNG
jgi:hypothetical protein